MGNYVSSYDETADLMKRVAVLEGDDDVVSPDSAAGTTYDNTDSGLTATDVQAAIDEVVTDLPSEAVEINYDNTTSGLAAVDVQAALDELTARVVALETP